jgi:hypothetical protein
MITFHTHLAALSAAVEEIEGALQKMGGQIRILGEGMKIEQIVSGSVYFNVSFNVCFDSKILSEYASQAKGQGRGNP